MYTNIANFKFVSNIIFSIALIPSSKFVKLFGFFFSSMTSTITVAIWVNIITSETKVEKTKYPKMSDYGKKFNVSKLKI